MRRSRWWRWVMRVLVMVLVLVFGLGQGAAGELPNVLLVGDSVTLHARPYVAAELAGEAVVWGLPENGRYSGYGLAQWESWRNRFVRISGGAGAWERFEVVGVNHGLWDVTQLEGGLRVPIGDYESNMRGMIWNALNVNGSGARPVVVVSTTTPIPEGIAQASDGDVVAYNAVLFRLVQEFRAAGYCVVSNDLYGAAVGRLGEWQVPGDIHFTAVGRAGLGAVTARVVRNALGGCGVGLPVGGGVWLGLLGAGMVWAAGRGRLSQSRRGAKEDRGKRI